MDEWYEILEPPLLSDTFLKTLSKHTIGNEIFRLKSAPDPEIELFQIALVGVPEDRNAAGNAGSSAAPDAIREQLYSLMNRFPSLKCIDLGNIKPGQSVQDTYTALSSILADLLRKKVVPVILGGSNDLAYANYLAYEKLEQIINIAAVDQSFDVGTPESELSSQTFLNSIVLRQPNFLFNYTNIGYQSYFVDEEMTDLMRSLFFDTYRIGAIRADIEEVEPMMRNADMICVDLSAVRQSDSPANEFASPNGFYGEEICRICRYAGMSDKVSSIGFYEMNPIFDSRNQSAKLTAQMIWFFMEGFASRKQDNPRHDSEEYIKFHVFNKKADQELIFFKSKKSGRWWMEIPCPAHHEARYKRHYLVACSYKDYQSALQDELPDRWWQTYQKIM